MDTVALEPEILDRIFHSISPEDRAEILSIGAAFHRLSLEKRLAWAQSKVQAFEDEYRTTLNQLEAEGLPDDAGCAMHEDYVEWHYWSRVLKQTRRTKHGNHLSFQHILARRRCGRFPMCPKTSEVCAHIDAGSRILPMAAGLLMPRLSKTSEVWQQRCMTLAVRPSAGPPPTSRSARSRGSASTCAGCMAASGRCRRTSRAG